jgi:hypothetical protein
MLKLVWDAEAVADGFFPTATVTSHAVVVFRWRGSFPFPTKERALVYARDYGEVAMAALRGSYDP